MTCTNIRRSRLSDGAGRILLNSLLVTLSLFCINLKSDRVSSIHNVEHAFQGTTVHKIVAVVLNWTIKNKECPITQKATTEDLHSMSVLDTIFEGY